MIRVLFLIPTLDRSGAEKQLALLASGLPRDEFEVEVIALTRSGPYAEELARHGVTVTVISKRWKFDPFAYWRLQRLLAERRPDILHTWLFAANAYGRLVVGKATSPQVIVSERCVDCWKQSWQLWLDRKLIARTTHMIGNSQAVAKFYADLGVPLARLSVIRNGIEPLPTPTRTRAAVLEELGIPANAKVVLSVGRLASQKRVADLLWGFHLLRNLNDDDVHFIIVGDGPERASLERFAEKLSVREFVRFTGHRADVRDMLAAADLFWLASEFEGQSNSLMEAMSAGLPVVVSDIEPNRELVEHEVTGLIVPTSDRPAYARAAQRLLTDGELSARLGSAAEQRMRQDFSVERMIAEHAALYRSVVSVER